MKQASEGNYPTNKLTIIGGGIVGFLEAYFAYLAAKQRGERIRVTIHEKNATLQETTTMHLVPSLTPDEIIAVLPNNPDELTNKLELLFSELGGIRVDDVAGVNDSEAANQFKRAVQARGGDEQGHFARTETLLALGKMSMRLWQNIYDQADPELKAILIASNFNPCQERGDKTSLKLHGGYRIDLMYNLPNALDKARAMQSDYLKLGYDECKILSPAQVSRIDPFLDDFCSKNSHHSEDGVREWNPGALALWRPGGCLDTKLFLPLFHDYLKRVMGQYTNDAGQLKDCFRFRLERKVEQLAYESPDRASSSNTINGLKFFAHPTIKRNKHAYAQSDYVFCPGEAVGTLKGFGLAEPEYARFAGASLMLRIELPEDQRAIYASLNHCMEVHQDGVVLAWQARCIGEQIFIGVGGTKAFYGDQPPQVQEVFAKNRNLLQLNTMNEVFPELISLAFGKATHGIRLTQDDMDALERRGIAERWVGSRAVAYDGFPTLGAVYDANGQVSNARCTTHLGSGGVSFGPAAVLVSRESLFPLITKASQNLTQQVLNYASSQRTVI